MNDLRCPSCGEPLRDVCGPDPTVDAIIEVGYRRIVLIQRKYPPPGWALPGGFVDTGETLEDACAREAKEETGLTIRRLRQLHTYSDPRRDPRRHVISTIFVATATGDPVAGDDAADARVFSLDELPSPLAFDHAGILAEFASGSHGIGPSPETAFA